MENLALNGIFGNTYAGRNVLVTGHTGFKGSWLCLWLTALGARVPGLRSEEHTSELQSLMRSSYAVFCLKKKNDVYDNLHDYVRITEHYVDTRVKNSHNT